MQCLLLLHQLRSGRRKFSLGAVPRRTRYPSFEGWPCYCKSWLQLPRSTNKTSYTSSKHQTTRVAVLVARFNGRGLFLLDGKIIPVHNHCLWLFLHCHQEHDNRVLSSRWTPIRISFQVCTWPSRQENPRPKPERYIFNFVVIGTSWVQFSKSIKVSHELIGETRKYLIK